MGVGEGDDMDGREKDRDTRAGEREIGSETGVGEREGRMKKNSWNFILSYFTPQNGVKHDSGL